MSAPSQPRVVACPRCGASVEWKPENRYRPFCTERCKLIDLGAWATEQYRVSGDPADPGAETAPKH